MFIYISVQIYFRNKGFLMPMVSEEIKTGFREIFTSKSHEGIAPLCKLAEVSRVSSTLPLFFVDMRRLPVSSFIYPHEARRILI